MVSGNISMNSSGDSEPLVYSIEDLISNIIFDTIIMLGGYKIHFLDVVGRYAIFSEINLLLFSTGISIIVIPPILELIRMRCFNRLAKILLSILGISLVFNLFFLLLASQKMDRLSMDFWEFFDNYIYYTAFNLFIIFIVSIVYKVTKEKIEEKRAGEDDMHPRAE